MRKFVLVSSLLVAIMAILSPSPTYAGVTTIDHARPAGGGTQQVYDLGDGTYLGLWGLYGQSDLTGSHVFTTLLDGLFNQTPTGYYYGPLYAPGAFQTGGSEFDILLDDHVATPNSDGKKIWDSVWVRWTGGDLISVDPSNQGTQTMSATATRTGPLPTLQQPDPAQLPVPEPATAGVLALVAAGLTLTRRRRQAA